MGIYDINGNRMNAVYDIEKNSRSTLYDVNGNLIPFVSFLDNAIVSNIYTSSISNQPQGGCIDDDGNIYVCFYSAGIFLKHNISTGMDTQVVFTPNEYGHANGMAYNPNTECLYLSAQNDYGQVFVFDKSFNLITTKYAKDTSGNVFRCWNIAYDRTRRRFITMAKGVVYFFDDNFDIISTATYSEEEWPNTRQDIETDGEYIYTLSYSPNKINVFSMSGNLVKNISCTDFTGEPESMCYDWESDAYYIEGMSGHYVIRQAVFKN